MDLIGQLREIAPVSEVQAHLQDGPIDFDVTLGGRRLLVETKRYNALRLTDIEAQIAWLSVQRRINARGVAGMLLVLEVPTLRGDHLARLRRFLEHCQPRTDLAIFSRGGGHVLSLTEPKREEWIGDDDAGSIGHSDPNARRVALAHLQRDRWTWGDSQRWLLSTLAFQHLSDKLWGGPRGPWKNVQAWANACRVSVPTAYGFLKALQQRGWTSTMKAWPATLSDRRGIARSWLEWTRMASSGTLIPVRPVRGQMNRDWLRQHLTEPPVRRSSETNPAGWECVLTGWPAIDLHGRLFVTDAPREPIIVVNGDAQQYLQHWRLLPCDARDAEASLTPTHGSLARFGGKVLLDGIPTTDIWQSALSVIADPRRGYEQAESIAEELWTS